MDIEELFTKEEILKFLNERYGEFADAFAAGCYLPAVILDYRDSEAYLCLNGDIEILIEVSIGDGKYYKEWQDISPDWTPLFREYKLNKLLS